MSVLTRLEAPARRSGPARRYPPAVLAVAALVALAAAIPLGFVIASTVSIGWAEAYRLIVRPRVGELVWNTARLVAGGVALCALLGIVLGWLVTRTTLPLRRVWHVLLVAPLAVPAFVNGFGWVSLTPRVQGLAGALLVVTLSYFPLVYLPVVATLRGLDPALEEAARSLGLGPWASFLRVVLPQLRVAVLGGSLLVGLHLLAEFGALQLVRFPTFTTAIYDQYRSSFNGPAANMLASVLVLGCLVLLSAELRVRGRHRYARVGAGAARPPAPARLGRLTAPVLLGVLVLLALALGVPLGSLAYWLSIGSSAGVDPDQLAAATATTVGLGVAAGLLTTAAALPLAWLAVRYRGALSTLLERSTHVGSALPGIVVALALVSVAIRYARPLYQTTALLLLAYLILFLPRALVSVRAGLSQAPPILEDIAHGLGARPLNTLRRVTLPLIAPGLGAGVALVFLAVVTELTATLLLAPIGTATLATQFWSHSSAIAYAAAAPYAAVMVLISAPATYLLTRQVGTAGSLR